MKYLNRPLPWLVLCFGTIFTCWAAWSLSQQIEAEARREFEIHALEFQMAIADRIRRYENVLFGVAGLMRHTDREVSLEEFRAYGDTLDVENRFGALDSLNYAKYIPGPDREKFIRAFAKETRAAGKEVIPALPPGQEGYMVITRTYPAGTPGLGFNLMGRSHRVVQNVSIPVTASLYAPDRPVGTGIPVLPPGRPDASLALRLGVFKPDAQGRPRLVGTAGIGFRIEAFFNEVMPPMLIHRVAYRVENIGREESDPYPSPVPIFMNAAARDPQAFATGAQSPMFITSFTVPFGGAMMRVDMSENKSALIASRAAQLPYFVLAAGFLLSALASILLWKKLDDNRELEHAIEAKKAELEREAERARRLEREIAYAAEGERRRIGRELHDDLGQRLTGVSLSFKALSETLQSVSSDLSEQASTLERHTSEAIVSVRGFAHGLMPVPAGPAGLREALDQLAISTTSPHGARCLFDFEDPVDVEDPEVACNLYRIAQEAVNNAVKHAHASLIVICLDYEDDKVALTVRDDGIGFDQAACGGSGPVQESGAGLRIMAYRASVISFVLTVQSVPGAGTTVKVKQC